MAAVKAIYAAEINSTPEENLNPWTIALDILSSYDQNDSDHHFSVRPDEKFLTKLIAGVFENLEGIDIIIERNLGDTWSKERIGSVMLALLRAAVYELSGFPRIPFKVIINEYLNVAKGFFSEKEIGFVNGILNKIAGEVRS